MEPRRLYQALWVYSLGVGPLPTRVNANPTRADLKLISQMHRYPLRPCLPYTHWSSIRSKTLDTNP